MRMSAGLSPPMVTAGGGVGAGLRAFSPPGGIRPMLLPGQPGRNGTPASNAIPFPLHFQAQPVNVNVPIAKSQELADSYNHCSMSFSPDDLEEHIRSRFEECKRVATVHTDGSPASPHGYQFM
mmetsp:Transcript_13776/g.41625  ORF Transcript_13776/g.41625 Transcript_13776/m.41625 type:complete len:123 (+) Transcript_13776:3-371(+)